MPMQFIRGEVDLGKAQTVPVAVRRMFILNDSPEMTCAPELDPVGERRLVMACIPCRVPARTRYSFDVKWGRPSVWWSVSSSLAYPQSLASEASLIHQAAGLVDDLTPQY